MEITPSVYDLMNTRLRNLRATPLGALLVTAHGKGLDTKSMRIKEDAIISIMHEEFGELMAYFVESFLEEK